jgi:hypothetical protein
VLGDKRLAISAERAGCGAVGIRGRRDAEAAGAAVSDPPGIRLGTGIDGFGGKLGGGSDGCGGNEPVGGREATGGRDPDGRDFGGGSDLGGGKSDAPGGFDALCRGAASVSGCVAAPRCNEEDEAVDVDAASSCE